MVKLKKKTTSTAVGAAAPASASTDAKIRLIDKTTGKAPVSTPQVNDSAVIRAGYNVGLGQSTYQNQNAALTHSGLSRDEFDTKTRRNYRDIQAKSNPQIYGEGNINLLNRPIMNNPDGSYSTVDSFSNWDDSIQKEVLVPTVIQDKAGQWEHAGEDEAWQHYLDTGEYLGKFDDYTQADKYAEILHNDQAKLYGSKAKSSTSSENTAFAHSGISRDAFDSRVRSNYGETQTAKPAAATTASNLDKVRSALQWNRDLENNSWNVMKAGEEDAERGALSTAANVVKGVGHVAGFMDSLDGKQDSDQARQTSFQSTAQRLNDLADQRRASADARVASVKAKTGSVGDTLADLGRGVTSMGLETLAGGPIGLAVGAYGTGTQEARQAKLSGTKQQLMGGISALGTLAGAKSADVLGGTATTQFLLKHGLSKAATGVTQAGLSGLSFGAIDALGQEVAKKAALGDEYQVDLRSVGKNAMVSTVFGVLNHALRYGWKSQAEAFSSASQARPASQWFDDCVTPEDVSARVRQLAKQYHPDVGGDAVVMTQINSDADAIVKWMGKNAAAKVAAAYQANQQGNETDAGTKATVRNEILNLQNAVSYSGNEAASANMADALSAIATDMNIPLSDEEFAKEFPASFKVMQAGRTQAAQKPQPAQSESPAPAPATQIQRDQMGSGSIATASNVGNASSNQLARSQAVVSRSAGGTTAPAQFARQDAAKGASELVAKRSMIASAARVFSRNGRETISSFYDGTTDPTAYYGDFARAYNAGAAGKSLTDVKYGVLNGAQRKAAYNAGQIDAAANLADEKVRAGYATVHGKESGLVYDKYVADMDQTAAGEIDQVAKMLGIKVQMVDSVAGGKANADVSSGIVSIEKGNQNPVRFLFGHEITHRIQELAPESYAEFRNAAMEARDAYDSVAQKVSDYEQNGVTITNEQAMDEIAADYAGQLIEDQDMLKRFVEQNRSNKTLLQRIRDAIKAIVERLTGKYRKHADRAVSTLEQAMQDATVRAQSLETKENAATTGGGVSYSIDPGFQSEIDAWDGKREKTFHLGSTSEALQEIGIKDRGIIWHSKKVSSILEKHTGMTLDVIKQVPEILEHPVAVLKSQNSESRIAIFGTVYDAAGAPVTAILELQPTTRGGQLMDLNVVASAYGKDSSPARFVENSDLLYLDPDKNRTKSWMQGLGLQLPSDATAFGSIGTVSYQDGIVKIEGVPYTQYMQDSEDHAATDVKLSLKGTDDYAALVEKYGTIKPGENPAREVGVPPKTGEHSKVSQTIRTAMEAAATPDEAIPTIEQMVSDGDFSYTPYSDKAAIADAGSKIEGKGYTASLMDWSKSIQDGVVSKANTAMGWALYNAAANSGDSKTAMTILTDMVGHQRNAAQAVQATRILKKMSPNAQLYGVQRSVADLQDELDERYGDQAPGLKIDERLAEKFLNAETQQQRDETLKDIYHDIGRQMPSRFIDKWNAWRYLAMLGNPRTHVRNVVGNAGFAPVVAVKDITAAGIETIASRLSGGKIERTKGFVGLGKADRALISAAWDDYTSVQEQALGEGKYNDSANANKYIQEGRTIFKSKALEAARKANGAALDAEDVWFSKPHYTMALAQYCKANGISAEQLVTGKDISTEAVDAARAYAIVEAQKATYRDTNQFSQFVSQMGRYQGKNAAKKLGSIAMEGILPFRKTPANILVRGVEYSPIGLLNGIKQAVADVPKGKRTAAEAIDSISSGLTGTGLLALGLYLAAQSLIRGGGSGDDKDKEYADLQGHQNYALELPNGTSITLDWLAPEALPLFIGVNLYEQTEKNGEDLNMSVILKSITSVTEPLLEMSCLQSLNDVFDAVGYAKSSQDVSPLISVLSSAATSYLTQWIPTLMGQAERTGQEERMTTYTSKDAFLTPDMQYTLGKISAKIPGWDYGQIPYVDEWGRTEGSGIPAARAFNNFLNPAYTSSIRSSPMEQELQRLYDSTGSGGVLPSTADKSFKVTVEDKNGDVVKSYNKQLTADEYVKYATKKGQTAYSILTDLTASDAYQSMSDTDKADAVSDVYSYANAAAKMSVSEYQPDGWIKKAIETSQKYKIPVNQFVTINTAVENIDGMKDKNGDTITNSKGLLIMQTIYQIPGLSDKQRQQLFADFGVGKTIIGWNKTLVNQKVSAMKKQTK